MSVDQKVWELAGALARASERAGIETFVKTASHTSPKVSPAHRSGRGLKPVLSKIPISVASGIARSSERAGIENTARWGHCPRLLRIARSSERAGIETPGICINSARLRAVLPAHRSGRGLKHGRRLNMPSLEMRIARSSERAGIEQPEEPNGHRRRRSPAHQRAGIVTLIPDALSRGPQSIARSSERAGIET